VRTRKPPAPSRSARLTCSACGARLRPAHRFCPNCGAPASPRGTGLQVSPETAVREDRRLVSVLFADLSGSTPLGERLDPEDLRRILGAFFAALVRPLQRYEGNVEKYMGDAVMAVFGAARALEFEPLGAMALKGKAQAVEAYRVVRAKDDAVADGSTPLVGRSAELALLRQALAAAVLGQGRAVTVAGEAGVGKSRLIAEFLTSLGAGVDRWVARGRSYDRQTSYAVLASLLRSALGIRQADLEPVARA